MALIHNFSSSSGDRKESRSIFSRSSDSYWARRMYEGNNAANLPNPKPDNYKIIRSESVGNCLIIEVQYLDCIKNYEGKKILVFENCTLEQLKKQKLIDPHFCENKKFISPIARFEPTERGWDFALQFAQQIHS